ncbi:MAG: sugar phosphate isomerase/epimerase [Eubacteriales bacterium]|nr:sugar phosphate isomerase/epimerase [Eubacteriales bacterium]
MKKMKIGFIGYIRPDEPDFWENAKALADLGYQGMEGATALLGPDGNTDQIKRLRDIGLQPLTVSVGMDQLTEKGIQGLPEKAHLMGVDNVSVYSCSILNGHMGKHVTYDGFMKDVEVLAHTSAALKQEGLTLRYHNHAPEFRMVYDGLTAFELLLRNTDDLQILLDVAWAAYGGVDPVQVINEWGPRLHALHLKDFQHAPLRTAWKEPYHSAFTSVGSGVVNIRGCMKAALDFDLTWGIMEQDSMNQLSVMDTLRTSYCNVKEYGLAE